MEGIEGTTEAKRDEAKKRRKEGAGRPDHFRLLVPKGRLLVSELASVDVSLASLIPLRPFPVPHGASAPHQPTMDPSGSSTMPVVDVGEKKRRSRNGCLACRRTRVGAHRH